MSLTIISKQQQQQRQKSFVHVDDDNTLVFNLNGNRNHGVKNLHKKASLTSSFSNTSTSDFPSLGGASQQKQEKKATKSWSMVAFEMSTSNTSMKIPGAPKKQKTPQNIKDKRRTNKTREIKARIEFEKPQKAKKQEKKQQSLQKEEFPVLGNKAMPRDSADSTSSTKPNSGASWSAIASTPKQQVVIQEEKKPEPVEEEPAPFVINIRKRQIDDHEEHEEQEKMTFTDWGNVPANWGDDDEEWKEANFTGSNTSWY